MSYAQPGQPAAQWRSFVNRSPIGSLFVVGIIATQLGTYFGYVFPAVGLPVLPWPLYNGILATTLIELDPATTGCGPETFACILNGSGTEGFVTSSDAFFTGHALHFVNGIVFAVLWGVMFRQDIAKFVSNNTARGLVYGVIMTIISAGLLVPYAYVPEQGYGLFLFDGPDGWKLPFGILIWHLIYGAFLGLLWNPDDTGVEATV